MILGTNRHLTDRIFPRTQAEGRFAHLDLVPSRAVFWPWAREVVAGVGLLVFIAIVVVVL